MISEITEKHWDAIVVGTGMGGGTLGRRLAESGMSVLFVEKGPAGKRAESQSLDPEIGEEIARRVRGFWPTTMSAVVDDETLEFFGPVGAGVGGTSVFYAAALERLERHDLESTEDMRHPTGGWPIGYEAFVPYYQQAEAMYQVCGTPDPLNPMDCQSLLKPPKLSAVDASMMQGFARQGLHPYRMHVGIRYIPGCTECIGHKCPRDCKMDARSAGIEPALATGRAEVLDHCEVRTLHGSSDRISYVEAVRHGEVLKLTGGVVVLAAGGYSSPRILLASASERWPNGCANESGVVGRNLMFHANEFIAIWPERNGPFERPLKTISLRDLYSIDAQRYGSLQSMGLSASYGNIVQFLNERFDRSMLRNLTFLREFLRIPALVATGIFGKAKLFAALLEDLPYSENRILYDRHEPSKIAFTYTVSDELKARHRAFRKALKSALRPMRSYFLNTDLDLNFGHPCGTVRFGDNQATSALDQGCRAHALKNLYVVDSSFMPTSGGVNPSLTIAANALRVADLLVDNRRRADPV